MSLLELIKKPVSLFLNIFRFHKLKIFILFLGLIIFTLQLFPYDDLKDFVTLKIYNLTHKALYLKFDSFHISLFPILKLELEKAIIDTPSLQKSIEASRIEVSPHFLSLLTLKPGGQATLNGLWGGDWKIDFNQGKRVENDDGSASEPQRRWNHLEAQIEKIILDKMLQLFPSIPVKPKGTLSGHLKFKIDSTFMSQPDGDFNWSLGKIQIPPSVIPTQMGELNLPPLQFSNGELSGRLSNSELLIEKLNLGSDQDPLKIKSKGNLSLSIQLGPRVQMGAYELKFDLSLLPSEQKRLQLFLMLFDSFKKQNGNRIQYLFKANGMQMGVPPNFGPLPAF